MKKATQERLSLILKARKYAKKMKNGSVFVTDFKALRLIEEMIVIIQDLFSENLHLKEQLKFQKAVRNNKELSE